MALPNSDDLCKLDFSSSGEPFCDAPIKSSVDLSTLDWSYIGEPFCSNPPASIGIRFFAYIM